MRGSVETKLGNQQIEWLQRLSPGVVILERWWIYWRPHLAGTQYIVGSKLFPQIAVLFRGIWEFKVHQLLAFRIAIEIRWCQPQRKKTSNRWNCSQVTLKQSKHLLEGWDKVILVVPVSLSFGPAKLVWHQNLTNGPLCQDCSLHHTKKKG